MHTGSQRNYDEMSTARLTWVVLDRLVPADEEGVATAALIARNPELQSLVNQGILTHDEAVERLRSGQFRYGGDEGAIGDWFVTWARRLGTFFAGSFCAYLIFSLAR